ncbi:MAG: hypothetical protein LUE88_07420 [Clostridiales bacterium]|nr:hypothetical protein [Clostridiales bacterium]
MDENNLITLIDRIPEIKGQFKLEQFKMGRSPKKGTITQSFEVIHNDPVYLEWKAEIECELDNLPETETTKDIQEIFRHMSGWSDKTDFAQLEAKLHALKNWLKAQNNVVPNDDGAFDKYSEVGINTNILKAIANVQANHIYSGRSEDEINDGVRGHLRMVYFVGDQTRQGESESGQNAGEVDLQIWDKDHLPIAIVEALKMGSLTKNNLDKHIQKLLTKYDPIGCPYVYVLVYAIGPDFASFSERLWNYINEYRFPYPVVKELEMDDIPYTETQRASIFLERNQKEIHVYFYSIHIS